MNGPFGRVMRTLLVCLTLVMSSAALLPPSLAEALDRG